MANDDMREMFERLESIERLVRSRLGDRGAREEHHREQHGERRRHHRGHDRDRDRDRDDGNFEEKRIIDTIVNLVGERIERMVEDREARSRSRDGGGDEKRIVDLVVRLVSEHVREIVVEELERRFGPLPERCEGEDSPPPSESCEPE